MRTIKYYEAEIINLIFPYSKLTIGKKYKIAELNKEPGVHIVVDDFGTRSPIYHGEYKLYQIMNPIFTYLKANNLP